MSTTYPARPAPPRPADVHASATPSLTSRLPELAARAAWRHRWRLAPVYLASCAGIGVGMGDGLAMAGGLGAAAVVAEVTARRGWKTRDGRMFLSEWERRLTGIGLATTATWAALMASPLGLPWYLDAALLGGGMSWPSYQWWGSRKSPAPLYSALAQHVLDGWAGDISIGGGPQTMRGSVALLETLEEPADGALAINFQLGKGVHAEDAVGSSTRKAIEALLGMPSGTVRLETIREHSTQVRAIITPSRHLEVEGGMDWDPVLHEDGNVPVGVAGDGSKPGIPLYAEDGIRHGLITGAPGFGKSVTSVVVLFPGVKARVEIVLYVDGKRGTSAPYLRPICGKYARMPQQWMLLIEMAHTIMVARQDRRGALGLHEWNTLHEEDPIITLFIDEATTVNKAISGKHVQMVEEILEHGRASGVRLIQASQDPSAEYLIGGVHARGLMGTAGWVIAHCAIGSGANRLTLDSTTVDIPLLGLPQGQAAIVVAGQVAGYPVQIENATKARVMEEIAKIAAAGPRQLEGADIRAVGADAWNAPHWDDCWTPGYVFDGASKAPAYGTAAGPDPSQPETSPSADDDELGSRLWVLDRLAEHPDGLLLGQLQDMAADDPEAPSRSTISRALCDLLARHQVSHPGAIWIRVIPEDIDEEFAA